MDELQQYINQYCNEDDQVAFRRFYRKESVRLWRYLIARGATEAQAYDLVSEAFLRFIKTVCRNPSSPSAFLFRIAQNLLIDLFRKTGSRELPLEMVHEKLTDQDVAEQTKQRDLMEAINKLSRDEQNIVLLRYWLGMTYKELSEIIGRPEGTLRRQGAAALATMKELLADYG
jgi:RNA polymerase sigma-70 factor (ECF subfamily)